MCVKCFFLNTLCVCVCVCVCVHVYNLCVCVFLSQQLMEVHVHSVAFLCCLVNEFMRHIMPQKQNTFRSSCCFLFFSSLLQAKFFHKSCSCPSRYRLLSIPERPESSSWICKYNVRRCTKYYCIRGKRDTV